MAVKIVQEEQNISRNVERSSIQDHAVEEGGIRAWTNENFKLFSIQGLRRMTEQIVETSFDAQDKMRRIN